MNDLPVGVEEVTGECTFCGHVGPGMIWVFAHVGGAGKAWRGPHCKDVVSCWERRPQ